MEYVVVVVMNCKYNKYKYKYKLSWLVGFIICTFSL